MEIFKGIFNEKELLILKKHNILIKGNKRYYLFDENSVIPPHGTPHKYKVEDFIFEGTNWTSLLIEFGNWFISKFNDDIKCIELKNHYQKKIFSHIPIVNFVGPLNNGLFINNNLGVNAWQQIVDLLNFLGIKDKGILVCHYPFQRENEEVGKMFWLKEANMFYRYLLGSGYPKDVALGHIDNLKILSSLYRNGKKRKSAWFEVTYVTNPYFLTADSKQDLSNALSQVKTFTGFLDDYIPTLKNIIDFKSELYYDDCDYSEFETKSDR